MRDIDHLLYRHWSAWVGEKRQHLFALSLKEGARRAGDPRDVTPGDNDGVPTSDTFEVGDDFGFSPDGAEIVTTCPPLPVQTQAWSANFDLSATDLRTGQRRNLAEGNAARRRFAALFADARLRLLVILNAVKNPWILRCAADELTPVCHPDARGGIHLPQGGTSPPSWILRRASE